MAVVGQARPLPQAGLNGMPNMRTPLFVFGVALALVAFLVMFAFGIVFVGRSQPSGSVPVVVANRNIDARTPITADMLTLSSVPAAAVPPKTYLHLSDLANMTAVVPIYKGQPISSNLVSSEDSVIDATQAARILSIPAGYVAFTLATSEQQGVAGYIAQGDYINVVAELSSDVFSKYNPRPLARTVFTDLYVIKVGPQTPVTRQGQVQGLASSITVVMSACDTTYMEWLQVNATLKYALVSSADKPSSIPTSSCPTLATASIGPAEVDARWHFMAG
jgi:Flp pilus assembly protein CpaB